MNNKILITIDVPLLDSSFDVFVPINRKIGTIKKFCLEQIKDLSGNSISEEELSAMKFYDKENCNIYDLDVYIKNYKKKNGTNLILI